MKILYSTALDGICIRRCFGLDGDVLLPEEIDGRPVTELGPYVFSGGMDRAGILKQVKEPLELWTGEEDDSGTGEAICDERVTRLCLPSGLRTVGAYAFYGCRFLEELEFPRSVSDWGAGVFTGCTGMKRLRVRPGQGGRSCLKEVLFELRQTLEVEFADLGARVVIPEFYEESVENTPARIIMRQMHGCGHMYRYCFEEDRFSFREYDRLFAYLKAEENTLLAVKAAFFRLYCPWNLEEKAKEEYISYLKDNPEETAQAVLDQEEPWMLRWLLAQPFFCRELWEKLLSGAERRGKRDTTALLMEAFHLRFASEQPNQSLSRSGRFRL